LLQFAITGKTFQVPNKYTNIWCLGVLENVESCRKEESCLITENSMEQNEQIDAIFEENVLQEIYF
jgi:hypothetical protein